MLPKRRDFAKSGHTGPNPYVVEGVPCCLVTRYRNSEKTIFTVEKMQ